MLVNASRSQMKPGRILNRADRNKALVSMLFTYLEQITKTQQQEKVSVVSRSDQLPTLIAAFRETAQMARTFCEGGETGLLETVIEMAMKKAQGPASSLGKLRKKLDEIRKEEKAE